MLNVISIPTKDELQEKLKTDRRWLERAVLAIYNNQTAAEQAQGISFFHNSKGFSSADARVMTRYALRIRQGRHLTDREELDARARMHKYATQLIEIAKEKQRNDRQR